MAFDRVRITRRDWIVGGGVLVGWAVVALWVVPYVLREAYAGTGPRMLNRLIEGQSQHPVGFYLAAWSRLAILFSIIVVLGLAAGGVARGHGVRLASVRRWFVGQFPEMSRIDLCLLCVFLGTIGGTIEAGGSVYRFALRHTPTENITWAELFWITPAAAALGLLLLAGIGLTIHRIMRGGERAVGVLAAGVIFLASYSAIRSFGGQLQAYAVTALALGVTAAGVRQIRRRAVGSRRLIRRTALAGVLIGGLWAGAIPVWRNHGTERALARLPAAVPGMPNILLIVWDTVRALDVSAYGYARETTPELARLATRGVLFERAISTAPWTLPSHASLFTGRDHHELSVDWRKPLDGTYPTLAEVLSGLGYATAGFVANTEYASSGYGLDRGFAHYDDWVPPSPTQLANSWWLSRTTWWRFIRAIFDNHGLYRKRAADVHEAVLQWIDRHPGRPFFAFLNEMDAHDPYRPPAPFDTLFAPAGSRYWVDHYASYEPDVYRQLRGAYDGGIAYMDSQLGTLLRELDRRGVLAKTLVIVASDHGEAFGENASDLALHGRSLYRSVLHVPLVVAFPNRLPGGVRVRQVVSLRQVPATILDLLGQRRNAPFPGPSLVDLIPGAGPPVKPGTVLALSHLTTILDGDRYPWPAARGPMFSLIDDGWRHYIRDGDGTEHLFDLATDPWEQEDLVPGGMRSTTVDSLRGRLDSLRGRSGRVPPTTGTAAMGAPPARAPGSSGSP